MGLKAKIGYGLLGLIIIIGVIILIVEMTKKKSENDLIGVKDALKYMKDGEQQFTSKFFEMIKQYNQSSNIIFSPHSIYYALLLAYFAAGGKTETELKTVLGFNNLTNKYYILESYKNKKKEYENLNNSSKVIFLSANKIFAEKNLPINHNIQKSLNDEISLEDFYKNPEKSQQNINKWVEANTKGSIKDLLEADSIDNNTKLMLINAAYFKGQWKFQFDHSETYEEYFYSKSGKNKKVEMMNLRADFKLIERDDLNARILEIPYAEGSLNTSLVLVLPNKDDAMDLLPKLTPDKIKTFLNESFKRQIDLKLPKLSFELTQDLIMPLKRMGLASMFDSADFSELTTQPNLFVDEIVHKAKIEITEEGTTAAAATSIGIQFRMSGGGVTEFYCNKPFGFYIYDKDHENVLFAGAYQEA